MADRACFPPPLPHQPNTTTSADAEANACFNKLLSTNGHNTVSPGLAGGDDVTTLPPVPVEPRSPVSPSANPRAEGSPVSPYAMGLMVGTMGTSGAAVTAFLSGEGHDNLNAMGDEVESWQLGTRVFGALGILGGGGETIAGGITLGVGVGTSKAVVGVPIAFLGGAMIAHGADTSWAGAQSFWTGEETQTLTARALTHAGLSPLAANLTDAGIGIAFSLGSTALLRSPRVVAAVVAEPAVAAEAAENAKDLTAAALQQQSGGRIAVGVDDGGHIKVMVQEVGENPQWSHLVSDWPTKKIEMKYSHPPRPNEYEIVELPVSAERASAATARVEELIDSQSILGSQFYRLGQADCMEYGAQVLAAGRIATPMTPRTAYLLQEVEREVDLLFASADETRAVAARLAEAGTNNADEAIKLKRSADDLRARAVLLTQDYIDARSADVLGAAAAQQPRLLAIEQAYQAALDEATKAYEAAQAALDAAYAAHAAKTAKVQTAAMIATGAHAIRAGEIIPLADLDPDTIIQIAPGHRDDGLVKGEI